MITSGAVFKIALNASSLIFFTFPTLKTKPIMSKLTFNKFFDSRILEPYSRHPFYTSYMSPSSFSDLFYDSLDLRAEVALYFIAFLFVFR